MVDAADLQEKASQAKNVAAAFAKGQLAEIKGRGPFFQAKLAIIAGYVLLALLTLILAPPGEASWKVQQRQLSFGLSFKTSLELTNMDNGDLEDVVVIVTGRAVEFDGKEVEGTWHTKPMSLPEQLKVDVYSEHLFDDKGGSPPYSLKITHVKVLDGTDTILDEPVGSGGH